MTPDKIKHAWKPIAGVLIALAVIAAGLTSMGTIGDWMEKHNPFFMRVSADDLHKKIEDISVKHEADKRAAASERLNNTSGRLYDQLYRARNEEKYLKSTNAPPQRTRSISEHIQNLTKQYKRANDRLEALEK